MSSTDCSCSTKDDPLDTWSSCNVSIDCKKETYELPPLDSKCYTRSKFEQEYLQEVWSAQDHPIDYEPVSKPTEKFQKYLLDKQHDHDVALRNFKTELADLHKLCNTRIEELERYVQVEIDKTHDYIEHQKRHFCQIICLDDEKYECLESCIECMLCKQKVNVDDLSEQIKSVEKERQNEAIKIFKKFYQIVRKLCHVPVIEHKSYFEKEIAVYNQTVLENNKNYEKIKLKFRLTIDVLKQNFYSWLRDVKDDRNAVCRKNALDDFYAENEKFNNAGRAYMKKSEGKTALCRLKSRTTIVSFLISQWDYSIPFPSTRFDDQLAEFNTTMTSTDATITGFIRSYKFYMSKHLAKLLSKVKKLRVIVEMMDNEAETEDEELTIVEEIYDKSKKFVDDFTTEVEVIWSNVLKALNDKAVEVFKIFVDFGSPWDVLSVIFLKQQDIVAQQLENRAIKSETAQLDFQQKILVEVPKLREEESIQKLEKKMTQVLAILEKKEQKFKSDFEEDCKIIRKGTELMSKEVNTMALKLDKFLDVNKPAVEEASKDNESTVTSYESGQSDSCFNDFKIEEIIMHDVELMATQVVVLDDYKTRFVKNMLSYRRNFEKEIMEVVELWQDNLIDNGYKNFESNLQSVQNLQMDIRRDAYDVRYNELIKHQKDLENHVTILNRLLNESTKCTDKLFNYSDIIEDYEKEVLQLINARSSIIEHSSNIVCLQNAMKRLKNNCSDKIDKRMSSMIERLMKKIQMANDQNEAFFSNVILFKDGGTYSNEEMNLVKKEMTALTKNIQKDESTNRITISKITDQAILEINNFDKANNDNLNVILEKLKIQEDVTSVIVKCEQSLSLQLKQAVKMNRDMMNKIAQLIVNFQNKVDINQIISTLNETITKVLKTLDMMKGPFPEIDVPRELESHFYNGSKNINSKKRTMSVKSLVIEPVNRQDSYPKCTCNADSFSDIASKLILDALAIINNKAMNYYTDLIYKKEELPFIGQNFACESCINNSLLKLNTIYVDAYNFWIDEAHCLSKFFESIEMPSIEWYLRDESISDEEKIESNVSMSTIGSDPNQYVSRKFNENVVNFQSTLKETLQMLQSKNTNGPLTISDESENLQ